MKISENSVRDAVLYFAEKYNLRKNYESILYDISTSLPEVIRLITHEMFLNEFDYESSDDETYSKYRIILEYSKELRDYGYVIFEN